MLGSLARIDFQALFQRVLDLLLTPGATWQRIRQEPDSGRALVVRYAGLLAVIPALAGFLGGWLSGHGFLFSLFHSVARSAVLLASVWIMGLLANAMAPSFATVRAENSAFRLVAYASTPIWVAGAFSLIPALTPLAALAGFGYAVVVFRHGCEALMETPRERSLTFSLAALGAWFGLVLIGAWIVYQVFAAWLLQAGLPLPARPVFPVGPLG